MKKLLLPLLFLPIVFTVQAKEYTPAQLKDMINSGNYPEQGPSTSQSEYMNFETCVLTAKSMMGAVADNYPVSVITDTNVMYMVKSWTNDGAVTVTCSQPDRKMVITTSKYIEKGGNQLIKENYDDSPKTIKKSSDSNIMYIILLFVIFGAFVAYFFSRKNKDTENKKVESSKSVEYKNKEDNLIRDDLPCLSGFKFGQSLRHLREQGIVTEFLSSMFGTDLYVIDGGFAPVKNDLIEKYFIDINEKLGITSVSGHFYRSQIVGDLIEHYKKLLKEKYKSAEIVSESENELNLLLDEITINLFAQDNSICLVYGLINRNTPEQLEEMKKYEQQQSLGI